MAALLLLLLFADAGWKGDDRAKLCPDAALALLTACACVCRCGDCARGCCAAVVNAPEGGEIGASGSGSGKGAPEGRNGELNELEVKPAAASSPAAADGP